MIINNAVGKTNEEFLTLDYGSDEKFSRRQINEFKEEVNIGRNKEVLDSDHPIKYIGSGYIKKKKLDCLINNLLKQINESKRQTTKKEEIIEHLLLIDEPEVFLHPSFLGEVATSIKKLNKKGVTIILTTHLPAFLSHFIYEGKTNLIIAKKNKTTEILSNNEILYFDKLRDEIKKDVLNMDGNKVDEKLLEELQTGKEPNPSFHIIRELEFKKIKEGEMARSKTSKITLKDKEREKEAQELENAEEEDIVNEECKKFDKVYPFEIFIDFQGKKGKALPDQIKTYSHGRIIKKYGVLDPKYYPEVEKKVKETKDNFLNDTSIKYLFNQSLSWADKKVALQEVDNFQTTDNDNINICFETIQGLHTRLNTPRENSLTYEDFQDKKIVLISDEAHHINVETKSGKQLSKEEREEMKVKVLQTDAEPFDRALQTVLLSQYRRKIFEKNGKVVKPVILFKSKTINESKEFQSEFIRGIETLTSEKLSEIEANAKDEFLTKIFRYLASNNISLDNFVIELKEDFSAEKTISVNSKEESEEKQLAVNTLEDPNNEYRAIFAVDKLNEGWDVLNLFDIVRLYDTRDAKNNIPGPTTIKEAQLIGRGARYCPFKLDNSDDLSKRKFDHDLQNEMRICEELYYHSNYNPRYIQELTSALVKTGIIPDNTIKRKLVIKNDFKNTEFYKSGLLFLNQQEKYSREDVFELPSSIRNFPYKVSLQTSTNLSRGLFENQVKESIETKEKDFWIKDLRTKLDEFIIKEEYLGGVKITVFGLASQIEELKPNYEFDILVKFIGQIASNLISSNSEFRGSKEFKYVLLKEKINNKELNFTQNENGKALEPDYVLFLRQKATPKSFHYQEQKIEQLWEDREYTVWGMPFYNKSEEFIFDKELTKLFARLGHEVALITLDKKKIGLMPCNPSVGGVAKGIVVREIDALGGEMGKAADATALQFKLLNTSNGPAVQALRVQSDKIAYARYMQEVVSKQKNLTVIAGAAKNLLITEGKINGVELNNGEIIHSRVVILTTGTYLQPITYQGKENKIEGPDGEKKVINNISHQLQGLGFKLKRFKTGTSPRILTNTIDFSGLQVEPGTDLPLKFSSRSKNSELLPFKQQLPCYLLHTNEKAHQIIRDNSHLSPIFYKKDIGTGPRYCPSIEDKIYRFADKERHQIFLEPESRELDTTYIQGLSTSLPAEIQAEILKNLPGLEKAIVKKWGYAIEYDVVDSTQLKISLETKLITGLFTAGQINGTTGYEEAAAQGLMAGINASRKLKNQEPLILKRDQAYIGVLIDDLVNKEITDPYRLLTSRAEYRLLLRHDNVYTQEITSELEKLTFKADDNLSQKFSQIDIKEQRELEVNIKYQKQIEKQLAEVKALSKYEAKKIPSDIDYSQIANLAEEAKEKLAKIKPVSFGQALRIGGVNPTDIQWLMSNINNGIHVPVMLNEVLDYLNLKKEGIYVDCTFGKGGHSRAILKKLEKGKLIALEWDKETVNSVQKDKFLLSPQFHLINDNFVNLEEHLKKMGTKEVDGFLFDLGLSSDQLAEEERGFSYRLNSPLDMRISQETKLQAADIVNNYSSDQLADIFYHYGEERKARVIARKICYRRQKERITNSEQLVGIIAACFSQKSNKHPARKVFQALRIFINNELENLTQALETTLKYLAPGGRVIVISYHSLEDRIVKQIFKKYGSSDDFQIMTKRPLTPNQQEIKENHRARIALALGAIIGCLITKRVLNKQMKEWQKQMGEPDKEQVRNMLSALGQKPSEEKVNRIINMTKTSNTPATRQRRKKILKQAKGYFGSKRKLFKTAKEQVMNAKVDAFAGRKQRKRDFLLAQIKLNRKQLSEMAIHQPQQFQILINKVIKGHLVKPDKKFTSSLVSQLINKVMRCGEKRTATRIVYQSAEIIEKNTSLPFLTILEGALVNIKPAIEMKSRKIGGSKHRVPKEIDELAEEIKNAYNKSGEAFKKRENLYKEAESGKRSDGKLPDPVSEKMIKSLLEKAKENKEKKIGNNQGRIDLNIGDLVKITEGTFINREGRITHLDKKKQKVKITIEPSGWEISDVPVNICQKVLVDEKFQFCDKCDQELREFRLEKAIQELKQTNIAYSENLDGRIFAGGFNPGDYPKFQEELTKNIKRHSRE
ncbi:7434_t:CDS:10 [Entrophospora sp. SA101]|nr:7434_t:CDS:10 [Entrophospora sp. SA101]